MSVPPTPTADKGPRQGFVPLVAVVDFHHARGPEVERWFGVDEGRDPIVEWDWGLLPFMALSDGAHALSEDFSYFTLLRPATDAGPATSLFGISCTRQIDSSQLLNRPADVTRSTVQKAVVVVADSPHHFGVLRERLSVVTKAWFAQREFTDVDILRRFQESLADDKKRGLSVGGADDQDSRDQYLGLSLRELVHEFRWQTLVLLKCALLQPKMLFFGTRCERLCLTQFSLISLIPGLLRNLQDSAGPDLDSYERTLVTPTSLRTSDRNSLLTYMGLPLQIFGKGSLFGPYTPLQQLDVLADKGTKSYIVGSTNSLLLQQRDRYSDILVNLDEGTINITSPSLRTALQLSTPDRRWIDFITQNVYETWDDANPSRPKTMGYVGSEEFIRMQFEEYLLALLSSVKYRAHLAKHANNPRMLLPDVEGDPSLDFGSDFVDAWTLTDNYRIWNTHTDSHLFDIVEPRHPCAGGFTLEDIQRRIAQQVQELHWDERLAQGKEVLGRNLAAGREKASSWFNKLYADVEALREAQRKKSEESKKEQQNGQGQQQQQQQEKQQQQQQQGGDQTTGTGVTEIAGGAQRTLNTVGSKAGAFVNSWAAWAGEKRRGWGARSASSTPLASPTVDTSAAAAAGAALSPRNSMSNDGSGNESKRASGIAGWTASWGRASGSKNKNGSNSNRASIASIVTAPAASTATAPITITTTPAAEGYEIVSSGRDDSEDGRPVTASSDASKRTTGDYSEEHAKRGLLEGYSQPEGQQVRLPLVGGRAEEGPGLKEGDDPATTTTSRTKGAGASRDDSDDDDDDDDDVDTPAAEKKPPSSSPPAGASDALAAEAAQAQEAWEKR
ncbi:hypothetical protein VTJ49DRAFT_2148 [Mycothermus thermophilus]|uniref:UDENN domain-containing protein n=1 Tax=Humicola insolens TaxID=85995 RepID=A0ABR3VQX7_HUMIN